MKFGFIAHPTSVPLRRHVRLLDLVERMSRDLDRGYDRRIWSPRPLVPFLHLGEIVSAAGATCEGEIRYLPLTAQEMIGDPHGSLEQIVEAVAALREAGAELVGLGGFTSIVGRRGVATLERSRVPVTSGNSLTAFSAVAALRHVFGRLEVAPSRARVAVVGYPGSIALVVARLLLAEGCHVDLVQRGAHGRAELLADVGGIHADRVTLVGDLAECLARDRFFVTATSSGGVLDPARLLPGSVVIDVALPRDVLEVERPRRDVLVIDGGYVSAGGGARLGHDALHLAPSRQLNGCVAETMVLALEGRAESYSIGRVLSPERVLAIGAIAARHGFGPLPLASHGEPVDDDALLELRRHHREPPASSAAADDVRTETLRRFREHVNPVLADLYRMHRLDRVFVKASGCSLTDADGREFLDMVAGYGCLNLGHNHPAVVGAMRAHLDASRPAFVQYVSIPREASLLAERLCELSPGRMERVFFGNSGTEAIEAALKLARAATGRPRFVAADNGYHGKTLGALSVTAREKHQARFRPLLPGCADVPYGDVEALRSALAARDVAAFLVEPIQGEGGVIVPPEGYLPEVARLCREAGTLLVVDEVQTGFGRTGRMFACEWEGIEPDILCLAKSLSGGLVPISATLSRADVWDAAYGTAGRFALHTSTFGGNALAASVGLAALDAIVAEDLPARALDVGEHLGRELAGLARETPLVHEVRGRGLMRGIELRCPFDGAVGATFGELSARVPGRWAEVYRFLPDEARQHLGVAIEHVESALEEVLCMRVVTKLAQDHGVLASVTANQSKVMRVQPPLVLKRAEADRFVAALREVCADLATLVG